MREQVIRRNFA